MSSEDQKKPNGGNEKPNGGIDEPVYVRDEKGKFITGNKPNNMFGYGQPTNLGGRLPAGKSVAEEMKKAAETYGTAANTLAAVVIEEALNINSCRKDRLAFIREANSRIYGSSKKTIEEMFEHLSNKVDKLYELNTPLLEATARKDSEALVRALIEQGKLDEVVNKIKNEGINVNSESNIDSRKDDMKKEEETKMEVNNLSKNESVNDGPS